MILYICGHDFHYEMENLCRVFFPNEKITVSDTLPESGAPEVETYLDGASGGYSVRVRVNVGDKTETRSAEVPKTDEPEKDECERTMARELFSALSAVTGYVPPWGILTGVRPSKLMLKLIESLGEKGAYDYFTKKLLVSEPKARLAQSVAGTEQEIAALGDERSFSLYIAIPFCPSRCSYCSFVSHSITNANAAKLLPVYVDDLCRELEITGKIVRDIGLRLESIYIGGGTPTTLEPHHLKAIFDRLKANFDFSKIKEFTLEAGRPDTITKDKLYEAKQGGVNRISINPQTMNEQTLKRVGRKHTPDMVRKCFEMARKMGFDNINMDLIAGLPEETVDMFKYSLDEVIKLDPENITVHSMCVKRAASLRFSDAELAKANDMNEMLSYTQKHMEKTGRKPYYMYRQKNISGNLENVGYAKEGCMSTYNINIMEEKQTIIALGGGGSTKIVMDDRIERVFNFKDPLEYIRRFDEILKKKDEILDILAGEKNG